MHQILAFGEVIDILMYVWSVFFMIYLFHSLFINLAYF